MGTVVRRIVPGEWRLLREVRLVALADAPSAFGSSYAAEVEQPDGFWIERAERSAAGHERTTFLASNEESNKESNKGSNKESKEVSDDASNDEPVAGLVSARRSSARCVELTSMWTAPAGRRRGVGRLLVEAVVEWAAAGPGHRVELWVTRGNDAAYRLYSSMGFAETGDHQPLPSDPCKDEIRMRLDLPPPPVTRP